jgi:hypothetical protein
MSPFFTATTKSFTAAAIRLCAGGFALLAIGSAVPGAAAGPVPQLLAPAAPKSPAPVLANLFEVKFRLPAGRGLARYLLEIGVDQKDAAEAARLAAGHLGDGAGGCVAKVAISRPLTGASLTVERVTLVTQSDRTVIDRRDGALVVTDQSHAVVNRPRIA